jgi:hypothetical protein
MTLEELLQELYDSNLTLQDKLRKLALYMAHENITPNVMVVYIDRYLNTVKQTMTLNEAVNYRNYLLELKTHILYSGDILMVSAKRQIGKS